MAETLWKHKRGDRYVLVAPSIVGNPEQGYWHEYYRHPGDYPTITAARQAGFRELDRSDDFNIYAVRGGYLAAVLWMHEVVDDDPDLLAEVAPKVGLKVALTAPSPKATP